MYEKRKTLFGMGMLLPSGDESPFVVSIPVTETVARYRIGLHETPPRMTGGTSVPVFEWKARPEVTGDSLDLIKAGLVPKADQDYSIRIEALDDKGAVLSESPSMMGQGSFRLVKKS